MIPSKPGSIIHYSNQLTRVFLMAHRDALRESYWRLSLQRQEVFLAILRHTLGPGAGPRDRFWMAIRIFLAKFMVTYPLEKHRKTIGKWRFTLW